VTGSSPSDISWRKSSYSSVSDCVELGQLPNGDTAMRDSKAPSSGAIVFTRRELSAFLQGVKAGEFDDLA